MNKSSGIVTRISLYVQLRKFTETLSPSAVSHSPGHPPICCPYKLVLSSITQRRAVLMHREQSRSPSPGRDFPSREISCWFTPSTKTALLLKPISHFKTNSVKHDFSCHFLLFWEKLDAHRFETSHPFVQWASDNYACPLGMKSTPITQVTALMIECFRAVCSALLFLPPLHVWHFETGAILPFLQVKKSSGRI